MKQLTDGNPLNHFSTICFWLDTNSYQATNPPGKTRDCSTQPRTVKSCAPIRFINVRTLDETAHESFFNTKTSMKRITVLLSLCALLYMTGCSTNAEEKKEEAVNYLVTSPLQKDTTITKDYVCQIHAIRHIELRAQQRGYIQSIFVDEGQRIGHGQLMFQIMPKLYEAELHKAQAEAKFADIEYQNTKKLADSKIVAPNEQIGRAHV